MQCWLPGTEGEGERRAGASRVGVSCLGEEAAVEPGQGGGCTTPRMP